MLDTFPVGSKEQEVIIIFAYNMKFYKIIIFYNLNISDINKIVLRGIKKLLQIKLLEF